MMPIVIDADEPRKEMGIKKLKKRIPISDAERKATSNSRKMTIAKL
jgi:hypothetical protein